MHAEYFEHWRDGVRDALRDPSEVPVWWYDDKEETPARKAYSDGFCAVTSGTYVMCS